MNLHTRKACRHAVHECVKPACDALFTTGDTLLTEDRARSFPGRSRSPSFQRCWPSVDDACEDGRRGEPRLRQVVARSLPPVPEGHDRWIGMDVCGFPFPCFLMGFVGLTEKVFPAPPLQKCKQRVLWLTMYFFGLFRLC
jgi:hypothetical protein